MHFICSCKTKIISLLPPLRRRFLCLYQEQISKNCIIFLLGVAIYTSKYSQITHVNIIVSSPYIQALKNNLIHCSKFEVRQSSEEAGFKDYLNAIINVIVQKRNYQDPLQVGPYLNISTYIFHLIFDLVSLVLFSNKYFKLVFTFIFHIPSNICLYEIVQNTNDCRILQI